MSPNERRLLRTLIILCIGVAIAIPATLRRSSLSEIETGVARYHKALEGISDTDATLTELNARLSRLKAEAGIADEGSSAQMSLADTVSFVKEALRKQGLKPDRYSVSGSQPNRSIEFALRDRPTEFFRFLSTSSLSKNGIRFTRLFMKSVKDSPDFDITFRIAYED